MGKKKLICFAHETRNLLEQELNLKIRTIIKYISSFNDAEQEEYAYMWQNYEILILLLFIQRLKQRKASKILSLKNTWLIGFSNASVPFSSIYFSAADSTSSGLLKMFFFLGTYQMFTL